MSRKPDTSRWGRTFAAIGDLPLRGQDLSALDPDTHRRVREVSFVFVTNGVMLPPLAIRYYAMGMWQLALSMLVALVVTCGAMLFLRRTHDPVLTGSIGCVLLILLLLASVSYSGGYGGPMMSWFYIVPIFGALLVGPRTGAVLAFSMILVTATFWRLPSMGVELPNMIPIEQRDLQSFIRRASALTALGILLVALNSQRLFTERRLEEERDALREQRRLATLAQREAEVANDAKTRFLSNLSHELRTPLNTIMGYSELILEEQEESGEATQDMLHVMNAALHLSHLFKTLFFLTSLESGAFEIAPSTFNPREAFSGLLAEFEQLAAQKGLGLELECPAELSVLTDPALILHLLRGLIDNAVKFTDDGHVRLSVVHDEESREVRIEVSDTGVGMDEETLERAFAQFSQADGFDERVHDGLGLGLSLCARIATLLDARLDLDSRLGEGTRATVTLDA